MGGPSSSLEIISKLGYSYREIMQVNKLPGEVSYGLRLARWIIVKKKKRGLGSSLRGGCK